MRGVFYVILSLVVLYSCKKVEEPNVNSDTADFYVKGLKNGAQFQLSAGDNNYYMFTSSDQNNEDVYYHSGRLADANCTGVCGEEFIFHFKGNKVSPAGNDVLVAGEKDFTMSEPRLLYGVTFNSNKTYTSRAVEVDYTWNFGDGNVSNDQNPYHLFEADKEYYDVSIQVKTSKKVESNLVNRIYTSSGCKTSFDLVKNGQSSRLVAKHEGGRVAQYYWEFEDGNTASVAELDYDYRSINGSERVCLTITDENGCVSQSCQNVIVNEAFAFVAANFDYEIEEVLPKNGFDQLNTVSVEYIDEKGEVFFSSDANNSQTVKIVSVEDYPTRNEHGLPVKRVHFILNGTLVSAQGNKIELTEMEGYIGVAYKEE
ncbi:MAG: hypothetical protein CL840_09230 [Crocinitomicaceae bacterium]|nr:hypothetical protein [Crocinitomicaceae bacterium]|tara:strand:- start:19059 stop:20171 length:1113 start_codon:yes stop_codon:yes gene_type:complete